MENAKVNETKSTGIDISELIDLSKLSDSSETLADVCEWQCSVEGKWWPIEGRQHPLTEDYAVRWTETEAGVGNVEIVERVDDEADAELMAEWLWEIAENSGSSNGTVR